MAINSQIPEINALKAAVEQQFGHKIECRSDFTNLMYEIENATREHISENTLRRIWGKLKSYSTVQTRTLDVLSRYVKCRHWDEFCTLLSSSNKKESAILNGCTALNVSDLNPGDRIRIGWLPNRLCIIEYQGGRTFRAVECYNSLLQEGDSFECSIMLLNHPLFLDNLVHGGELCERYSIGLTNGITLLEKI